MEWNCKEIMLLDFPESGERIIFVGKWPKCPEIPQEYA